MSVSLSDIASRAGKFPAYAKNFGKTLNKLAESVIAYVDAKVASPGLPEYADDAAAGVGGLVASDMYVDTTDTPELIVKVKS